jgi:hypothetical protein
LNGAKKKKAILNIFSYSTWPKNVKKSTSLKMDAIKILQDLMFHAKLQHVDILLIETRK